ncbi:MAG: hypothetical protein AAGN82_32445 [Myxococcota bacterium]
MNTRREVLLALGLGVPGCFLAGKGARAPAQTLEVEDVTLEPLTPRPDTPTGWKPPLDIAVRIYTNLLLPERGDPVAVALVADGELVEVRRGERIRRDPQRPEEPVAITTFRLLKAGDYEVVVVDARGKAFRAGMTLRPSLAVGGGEMWRAGDHGGRVWVSGTRAYTRLDAWLPCDQIHAHHTTWRCNGEVVSFGDDVHHDHHLRLRKRVFETTKLASLSRHWDEALLWQPVSLQSSMRLDKAPAGEYEVDVDVHDFGGSTLRFTLDERQRIIGAWRDRRGEFGLNAPPSQSRATSPKVATLLEKRTAEAIEKERVAVTQEVVRAESFVSPEELRALARSSDVLDARVRLNQARRSADRDIRSQERGATYDPRTGRASTRRRSRDLSPAARDSIYRRELTPYRVGLAAAVKSHGHPWTEEERQPFRRAPVGQADPQF